MTSPKVCLQWDNHSDNLSSNLSRLLENNVLVDISLTCHSQTIQVHKCVLAACSPYFQERFEENNNIVSVIMKNIEFSVIKSLVEFIYTGRTYVAEDEVTSVISVAAFFKIRGLSGINTEQLGLCNLSGDLNGTIEHPDFIAYEANHPEESVPVSEDFNETDYQILNTESDVYETQNETNGQDPLTINIPNSQLTPDKSSPAISEGSVQIPESQICTSNTEDPLAEDSAHKESSFVTTEISQNDVDQNFNNSNGIISDQHLNFLSSMSDVQKVLVQKLPTLSSAVNKLNIISRETIKEMLMTNNISSASVTTLAPVNTECQHLTETNDNCTENSESDNHHQANETNDIDYEAIQTQLEKMDGVVSGGEQNVLEDTEGEEFQGESEDCTNKENDSIPALRMLESAGVPTDVPIFCEDSSGEIVELTNDIWKEIAKGGQILYQIVDEEGHPSELLLGGNENACNTLLNKTSQNSSSYCDSQSEDSASCELIDDTSVENQYTDVERILPKFVTKTVKSDCYSNAQRRVGTSFIDSRILREQEIIGDDDHNGINEDVMLSSHNRNMETPEVLESEQQRMLLTPDSSLRLEQKESYDDFYCTNNSNIEIGEKIILNSNEMKQADAISVKSRRRKRRKIQVIESLYKNMDLFKNKSSVKCNSSGEKKNNNSCSDDLKDSSKSGLSSGPAVSINKKVKKIICARQKKDSCTSNIKTNKKMAASRILKNNSTKEVNTKKDKKIKTVNLETVNNSSEKHNDNKVTKIVSDRGVRKSSRPSSSPLRRPQLLKTVVTTKNTNDSRNCTTTNCNKSKQKKTLPKRKKKCLKSESEKDIPYALGLLPLDTALKKIQNMPEHTPRMTRSSAGLALSDDNKKAVAKNEVTNSKENCVQQCYVKLNLNDEIKNNDKQPRKKRKI